MEFKVGDKVRIKKVNTRDDNAQHEFEIGEIVTIDNIDENDEEFPYHAKGEHDSWWVSSNEIEEDEKQPRPVTFMVGDKARVVAPIKDNEFPKGEIVTITALDDMKAALPHYYATNRAGEVWRMKYTELEKVEKSEPVKKQMTFHERRIRDRLGLAAETSGPKFKIGDKVIVVNPEDSDEFEKGEILTITALDSDGDTNYHHAQNDEGKTHLMEDDEIEMVDASPEFKVGDKVRVVTPINDDEFEKGEIITIQSIRSDERAMATNDEGTTHLMAYTEMEKVKESAFKFKIDDKVKIIRPGEGHEWEIGEIVTIISVDENDENLPYKVKKSGIRGSLDEGWVGDGEIEKVREESEPVKKQMTFHERMIRDRLGLEAEDRRSSQRMTRAEAEVLAAKVVKSIEPFVDRVEVCGSYRRGSESPGDLDVILIPKSGMTLPQIVEAIKPAEVHWLGDKKAQVVVDGRKVDFRVSSPEGWGAALLYFTGPVGYNIGMRVRAKKMGMKLNEYGIFERDTNKYLGGKTEDDVYRILEKTPKAPELRAESIPVECDYCGGMKGVSWGTKFFGDVLICEGLPECELNRYSKGYEVDLFFVVMDNDGNLTDEDAINATSSAIVDSGAKNFGREAIDFYIDPSLQNLKDVELIVEVIQYDVVENNGKEANVKVTIACDIFLESENPIQVAGGLGVVANSIAGYGFDSANTRVTLDEGHGRTVVVENSRKHESEIRELRAEEGKYAINWNPDEGGADFDWEGGEDSDFDDKWTDIFWDESNPEVTKKEAESKKLPATEKAMLTGASTGATMEGLETLLAAEDYLTPCPLCGWWNEANEPCGYHGKLTKNDLKCDSCGNSAIGVKQGTYIPTCGSCSMNRYITSFHPFGAESQSESFEAAKPSKWAGWCPKCRKWRTKQMSYAPHAYYRRDGVPTGVILCAKKVRRDGYWKDMEGTPQRCDTPLSKKQGGVGGDVPYNPPPFNPDARRIQRADSFSPEDGIKYVGWQKPAPTYFGYYMSRLHAAEPPYETTLCGVKLSREKEIFYFDNPHAHVLRCSKCQKSVDKRKTDFQSESFSTDSQSESALAEIRTELSEKRTRMSCVRTGLAFATFGIVLANAIVLRKHAKED